MNSVGPRMLPQALVALALAVILPAAPCAEPSKQQLDGATHFTEEFEKTAARQAGKPFDPERFGGEAMRRVMALAKQYPDHPKIQELRERVRKCIVLSKGAVFEIKPEMIAYLEQERQLAAKVSEISAGAWQQYRETLGADPSKLLPAPFPIPDPRRVKPEEAEGKIVVVTNVQYPERVFVNSGVQYIAVGSPSIGHYFLRLDGRGWLGAYEALKRYRQTVSPSTEGPWTVAGRIVALNALVPDAAQETGGRAFLGWEVEPEAIWVPDTAFSRADPNDPRGGTFGGETEAAEIKQASYSIREIPPEITPERLIETFATAIKEKNFDLYLRCLDPGSKIGPKAMDRIRYFWENGIERFHRIYVHVEPLEVGPIYVIKGEKVESAEAFFLKPDDIAGMLERADDLVEGVDVKIRHFDAKGKQVLFPNTIKLRRVKGGQWTIFSGHPL